MSVDQLILLGFAGLGCLIGWAITGVLMNGNTVASEFYLDDNGLRISFDGRRYHFTLDQARQIREFLNESVLRDYDE